ncbi:MAG: DUF5060 domain-containing protein [Saprospiraceae bacterium]|nr:DUF5060 domain-containing protein [Saprospiraceae bacterium]
MKTIKRSQWYIILLLMMPLIISATPVLQNIRTSSDTVGRYDKFEIVLHFTADYLNPFDPDEITLDAIFTGPDGKKWKVPGFYNYTDWRSNWMVRFSPDQIGKWTYQLMIEDRDSLLADSLRSFIGIESSLHGPIRIAKNDRYLEHADGTSFYGVGFWYNDNYNANGGSISGETLDDLKGLGLNFISSYITPLETIGSGLGRYDQNICQRLDEVLNLCEEKDFVLSLNIWFHPYLSETVWAGGNRRWMTNPYQQICDARDFFRNKLAWNYQEKLYRYFIARWGYSRALGIWFIVDEVNGTDGWVSGDSTVAAEWGQKVHDYFKKNDPYGHLTTGTRSGGFTQYWHEGYETFDLAAREIYEAQGFPIIKEGDVDSSDIHPLTYSYHNYAGELQKLWKNYDKPAIIGETGWDHTFYEPGMPGYLAYFHNTLWVSLATGGAMTPFWWAYSVFVNDMIVTRQLRSVERFAESIPFNQLSNLAPVDSISGGIDAFAMSSDQLIFGWVVNPRADVGGDEVHLYGQKQGKYKLKIFQTWNGRWIHEEEIMTTNGTLSFKIPNLRIEGGHARYVGQDVAFILERQN